MVKYSFGRFAIVCLAFIQFNIAPALSQDLKAFVTARNAFATSNDLIKRADPDYTCTETKGCDIGCCGAIDPTTGVGVCGLGPDFCADGCVSSCDYKSECDPGWGMQYSNASVCPLNVCCSPFGFCGTTADFCQGKTAPSPQCTGGTSADVKTIGYYEGWNLQRACGTMAPEDIPMGWYTHINFAFALVNPTTFRIDPMDTQTETLYNRVTSMKAKQPGLQVWIAIGGWAMNDPGPYRTTFSDLAASEAHQDEFFEALITFMQTNSFDGIDIDWEYPSADDRGGVPDDKENYVNFLKRLRARLNASGRQYGVSVTLPASYWYLQGFDIVNMEPWVDWFNVMTYDIHGVWDSTVKSIGPYAYAHTNLTEIQLGLELLWRNNINPARVVMGLGFYARTFTMKDPSCMAPGCEFTDGAKGGACTGTPGVLSAHEMNEIISGGGATITFDEQAAAKIVTWDTDQWASWDDVETLKIKVDYANQHCLGGTMVWAVDLDDGTLIDALGSTLNREKTEVYPDPPSYMPCFGMPWDPVTTTSAA